MPTSTTVRPMCTINYRLSIYKSRPLVASVTISIEYNEDY